MNDEELRRMMGTAGLGIWTPAGGETVPPTGAEVGLWSRLDGVRTRLSGLAHRFGWARGLVPRS